MSDPQESLDPQEPLLVVGAGPVGLITAIGFAQIGREVWCVDIDQQKVDLLARGEVEMTEPDLAEALRTQIDRGLMHFEQSLEQALQMSGSRFLFVAVGTPSRQDESESADMTAVTKVIEEIPADSRLVVVMKSTVPPGSGEGIVASARAAGKRFAYVSCPEFLCEGEAMSTVTKPDRVVIGVEPPDVRAGELVVALHEGFLRGEDGKVDRSKIVMTNTASAETSKYAANFNLATSISYTNEIANFCEHVKADILDVMKAVGLDSRIGPHFLRAGLGYGGSCFPKDLKALRAVGTERQCELTLASTVSEINKRQVDRAVAKLISYFGDLNGKRVALLGLAFKPHISDLREGQAFALAHSLRKLNADIQAYDPDPIARAVAEGNCGRVKTQNEWIAPAEMANSAQAALEGVHACVLVTEWPCFNDIDWGKAKAGMVGDLVIDGRNALDEQAVREAGLKYEGWGRQSSLPVQQLSADSATLTGSSV